MKFLPDPLSTCPHTGPGSGCRRPPYGLYPHPETLGSACLDCRRQESLSPRTTRRAVGLEIRGCAGTASPRDPHVSHPPSIEKSRKCGVEAGVGPSVSPCSQEEFFPAHTQRLWAPQRAAPGHVHSVSKRPKDVAAVEQNTYPPQSGKGGSGWA